MSNNYCIQTFTGKEFDLEEPTIDMINIEDVAHHLSIENRFNGATKFPYSVAYHSLLVCRFAPDYLKLEALLHDAYETWYKDLTSPLKRLLCKTDYCYREKTNLVDSLLVEKFQLQTYKYKNIIKDIDLRMAITERNQLCGTPLEKLVKEYEDKEPYDVEIIEMDWRVIEKHFLNAFEEYRRN